MRYESPESYLTQPLFRQIVARIDQLVGAPPEPAHPERGR